MKTSIKQRVKYILAAGVAMLVIGGSLLPALSSSASAAPAPMDSVDPFYQLDVSEQAKVWGAYETIKEASCQLQSGMTVKEAANASNWFNNNVVSVGVQLDPTDGKLKCSDENNWFSNLLNDTSFSEDYNALAKIVYANYNNGYNGGSTSILAKTLINDNQLFTSLPPTKMPDHIAYYDLINNFTSNNMCKARPASDSPNKDAGLEPRKIWVYDASSQSVKQVDYVYDSRGGDGMNVGFGLPGDSDNNGTLKCSSIANLLQNRAYADAYLNFIKAYNKDTSDPAASSNTSGQDDLSVNCGSVLLLINPINWFVCPIIEGMATAAQQLDNLLYDNLCVNQKQVFDTATDCSGTNSNSAQTSAAYHDAWGTFRYIAIGILVITGLIMIISQGLGFEFVDAYTIRKVLPRLLIAAIAITLSWQLLDFFVGFTNSLGLGIRALIYSPFHAAGFADQITLGGGGTAVADIFALGAFAALGPLGLLSFIGTALLTIIVAFLVLVLRNILVILLIIIAPIAIACYVLPNTQNLYKIWWDWFSKALLMFPIIMAFIAVGHVFAAVAKTQGGTINNMVAFVAYFAPYLLLPLAFRFAGGAIRNIGGFVNDRGRGGFDRLKKYRGGKAAYNLQRLQNQSRWDPNSKLGSAANKAGTWATSPLSNAAYKARNNRAIRSIPIVGSSVGRAGYRVASSIEHAGVEQSGKLFEELNKMGYNDRAYRMLSGAHSEMSKDTKERLTTAGLFGKQVSSITKLQEAADILALGDDNERIAANAIHGSMGRLSTLFQDPEMLKADVGAAGIMGLAAHGFASGADLAQAGNELQKSKGEGFAQAIVSQAQVMGVRSRPDTKAGYGIVYKDGQFLDGITAEGGRAIDLVKTLQSHDLAAAKGGAIKALKPTITHYLDGSEGAPEQQAVREQLFSWAGPYSQASVDVKAEALKIIEERKTNDPAFYSEWIKYNRGALDPELRGGDGGDAGGGGAAGGGGGAPE